MQMSHRERHHGLTIPKCATHGEDIKFYDTQCNKPVCLPCLSLDHHGHKCVGLAEAAADVRKQMAEAAEIWAVREKEARAAEAKISAVHEEVKSNADRAREATRQCFTEVRFQVS